MSVLTIEVSDELRQVWPQFRGAAVFAEVRNTPYSESLWKRIGDYTALYRERYTVDSIKEMPAIQATRQATRNAERIPAAIAPLLRRFAAAFCGVSLFIRLIRW